jgi:aminopeptidase N
MPLCPVLTKADEDLRAQFDVKTYRLDLKVDPKTQTLSGTVGVAATVVADRLETMELDLIADLKVTRVNAISARLEPDGPMTGPNVAFTHEGDLLKCRLPKALKKGEEARVAVTYSGRPGATGRFGGFHWGKTPDGKPWISTSCQTTGASTWWPCKDETSHPEDKHDRIFLNYTVPKGLTAVANGRLLKTTTPEAGWETFHWRHDYPCETYAITMNVAPYIKVHSDMKVPGLERKVAFDYYVLPQDLEKANLEFKAAPRMVAIYSEAFGPFPFPRSKFCLVETDFWGMEHSTAVAYGNTFPTWLKQHKLPDRYAQFNRLFDYIIIHECAHEWWGNAVSAADWGHLWIHEGFATYTEGVYVEKMLGRDAADEYYGALQKSIDRKLRLFRGTGVLPRQAFSNTVYYKGAMVLNMLRHFVNDDAAWWKSLREFNMRFRYKNARTEDFQKVLEEITGKPWEQFFREWFYGVGYPSLKGTVSASGKSIVVDIANPEQDGTGFHIPLDLEWKEGRTAKSERVWLEPGTNHQEIACIAAVEGLRIVHLDRILADRDVKVAAP